MNIETRDLCPVVFSLVARPSVAQLFDGGGQDRRRRDDAIGKNHQSYMTHAAALAATAACSLLLVACGSDDDESAAPLVTAQQACATLSGKTIGGATLTAVVVAASGAVPTHCKVNGTLEPSLNFEMRLPDAWNGKLYYGGGGGYGGSIPDLVLPALTQGYAAVASDSGHQGTGLDASFALNNTFAAQLFGSLAVPTVMSAALEVVTAAYGSPPTKS